MGKTILKSFCSSKIARLLAAFAVLALLTIGTVLYFWRPIAVEIMRHVALAEFRAEHSIGDDELHLLKGETDWIYTFGGSRSLPELRRMSTDPSLDQYGQRLATRLADFIETGEHVLWYEKELDPKYKIKLGWPRRSLTEYICQQDQHLKPKGIQP